mmetsp:Transcript_76470/g.224419  ORF Transcript_76470/g.224419 Transcript_76470/m.224419 type:complete len:207 (-) Transcript_76470:254-874(-)
MPLSGTQGARVSGFKYGMARSVHKLPLLLRKTAPEQEDHPLRMFIYHSNHSVCEALPTTPGMGVRLCVPAANRQSGIEQQHALPCPLQQVPVCGSLEAVHVGGQLLVHVLETRRRRDARWDAEAEAMRLPWLVVGVLAKKYNLQLAQRCQVEGLEDLVLLGIHGMQATLLGNKIRDVCKVRRCKFARQGFFPTDLAQSRCEGCHSC